MSDAAISNCDVKIDERMQQNSKGDTNFKSWFDKKKKKITEKSKCDY